MAGYTSTHIHTHTPKVILYSVTYNVLHYTDNDDHNVILLREQQNQRVSYLHNVM